MVLQDYLMGRAGKLPASQQFNTMTDPKTGEITMLDRQPGQISNKKFKDKVDQLSFLVDRDKSLRNDKSFTEKERAQEILRRKKIGFRNAYRTGYRFNKNELEKIRNITGEDSLAFLRQ
jgi:hypothetical protein